MKDAYLTNIPRDYVVNKLESYCSVKNLLFDHFKINCLIFIHKPQNGGELRLTLLVFLLSNLCFCAFKEL